jgi:peroxiredoxin
MKKLLPLLTLVYIILLSYGCGQNIPAPVLEIGKPAPNFTISDTKGKTWTLSELRGQVVFVNFWATWCPPCVKEMPAMQELNSSLPPDKFKILAILYNDAPAMAENLVAKLNLTFPILIDPQNMAARSYGLTGVPETYIIDKQGLLREKFIGPVQWNSPNARQMIMKYIAE